MVLTQEQIEIATQQAAGRAYDVFTLYSWKWGIGSEEHIPTKNELYMQYKEMLDKLKADEDGVTAMSSGRLFVDIGLDNEAFLEDVHFCILMNDAV